MNPLTIDENEETDLTDYPSVSEVSYSHRHHRYPHHHKPPLHPKEPSPKPKPCHSKYSPNDGSEAGPSARRPSHDRRKRGSIYTVNPEQLQGNIIVRENALKFGGFSTHQMPWSLGALVKNQMPQSL